jgi:exosortase B
MRASQPTLASIAAPTHRPWQLILLGVMVMVGPTLWRLAHTIWTTDEQAHGPIILALSLWLTYRKWPSMPAPQAKTERPAGAAWALLGTGCLFYVVGRSQSIMSMEVGALILVLIAALWMLRGPAAVKHLWFPLFFLLFMIPLPGVLVATVTQPLKIAVSTVAEWAMYGVGYPIARTGVILQIGPYQLLVADACAGLHTLFTLEALGLLYLNMVQSSSALRNIALAILIVPISFTSNVIRVIVLSLITYHFGDEAGQGFLHGFAGMVLFLTALMLIMGTDRLLGLASRPHPAVTAGA